VFLTAVYFIWGRERIPKPVAEPVRAEEK